MMRSRFFGICFSPATKQAISQRHLHSRVSVGSFSRLSRIEFGMIELKLRETALRLDFTFFAAVAFFLLTDNTDFGITALLSCAAHELAHLLVMRVCGAEITAVTLYGAGIRIRSENAERLSAGRQNAIYSAGCVTNFALAAGLWAAGAYTGALINICTGLFNLLPLGELDGARLLKAAVIRVFPAERVDGIMRAAAVVSAVLAITAVLLAGGLSVNMIIMAAYIALLLAFGG